MEDDKKRRKNKKKKNKQATKPTESVTVDEKESTSKSKNHVLDIEQNSNGQISGVIDSSNDVGGNIDVDRGENHANGNEGSLLEERIEQLLKEKAENAQREQASERDRLEKVHDEKNNASMENEALLEERVKQLLKEKDDNAQKEISRIEEIKHLCDERNALMQNEASLKEKLVQLEKENGALSHNEGIIEQKILHLQTEVEIHLHQEATLEAKILQLEGEKNSWIQKEVGFEDKINELVDEAAFLNLTVHETQVSLQEKVKQMEKERDSLILKENSAKESVASLTIENTKLQAQVTELEQTRESLLKEKEQLSQTVSSLQLQINNLESRHSSVDDKVTSEDGDVNGQIEAARALIERLIIENSDLVEKVTELYAELDQRGPRTEQFSFAGSMPEPVTNQSVADRSVLVTTNLTNGTDQATDSISEASNIVEDQRNGELVKVNDAREFAKFSDIMETGEIVQIPLDESEIKKNNVGAPEDDEKIDDVLLTDAPLIGAPFRLISFVARYVSGADLVDKNTGRSG